uniref:Uncharacterized protein n=1 Tax=Caenorhabditis japonica TaxID=281687 RepID=A0A8R1IE80_CAEJA
MVETDGAEKRTSWKQNILNFVWGAAEAEEEPGQITESFITHVRAERPFKLAASFAFFILVFVIGMPMWHLTTSSYRAPFATFSANRSISVPIRVLFVTTTTSDEMQADVTSLMEELKENVTSKEVVKPLDFQWTTQFLGVR